MDRLRRYNRIAMWLHLFNGSMQLLFSYTTAAYNSPNNDVYITSLYVDWTSGYPI